MEPTAIAGMHRSGTSMVARVLNLAGLYLGDQDDLVPSSPENPDGYWEHAGFVDVNDQLLHDLGGGWDRPVLLPPEWQRQESFAAPRARAQQLIARFSGHDPWGWKDPRSSLLLPFWREFLPGMSVVICLRHPLEVALSLQRRGMTSYSLGLSLWETYNECVLDSTEPQSRIITQYDSYFVDPMGELSRVAKFIGLEPSGDAMMLAMSAVRTAYRHSELSIDELKRAEVTDNIRELYLRMSEESRAPESMPIRSRRSDRPRTRRANGSARAQPLGDDTTSRTPAVNRESMNVEVLRRKLQEVRDGVEKRDEAIASLEAQLVDEQARRRQAEEERASILRALDQLNKRQDELTALAEDIQAQLDRRGSEIQSSLYTLQGYHAGLRTVPTPEGKDHVYRQTVDRIREVVHARLPSDATVLVASRGDEELVKLYGRRAWHFPGQLDGGYVGYHPTNSAAAIVHLDAMCALGATHFVLPSTMSWWLDSYDEFRQHLESHYRLMYRQDDTCRIYSLEEPPRDGRLAESKAFRALVAEFRRRFDHDPVVLDWSTERELARTLPELQIFSPPVDDESLAYLDGTIDVVAIASSDQRRIAEAKRVASKAAVIFEDEHAPSVCRIYGGTREPVVMWLDSAASVLPTASIIIPCYDGVAHTRVCLESLLRTLPANVDHEVILIDDASRDGTSRYLHEVAHTNDRFAVMRNASNQGYLTSVNRGAAAASGDILVFLNNDTILLDGSITELLRTFRAFDDAGVVGGKLLYPDGRVQEAGGIVFCDGSAAKFGAFDPDPTATMYNFVRDVHYCSGALLATPRTVFEQLDGFDPAYAPGYYEDTDYCFRARAHGLRVIYQPASTIIHLEGATAGRSVSHGMKRHQVLNHERFVTRWQDVLASQPERPPEPFDILTRYELLGAANGVSSS